ncbi:MAG: PrsW family glutamic-type intramembrane protease [Pyrinomonadaceae bacterium]
MKLLLTIESGSLAGQTFDLTDGFITIGRSENCSVRFDPLNEKIASKQHAFIEAKPDGFHITDNTSTNGTYVNDERIQSVKLNSGDRVQFGRQGNTARVSIAMQSEPMSAPTVLRPNADFGQFQSAPTQFAPAIAIAPQLSFKNTLSGVGINHVEIAPEPPRSQTKRYIIIGTTIFAVVFMSLIVMLLMFFSVGPVAAVIATVVAFTPAMFYLMPMLWLDRYDPEPFWLLALAFAWGALVSVIVSFIINTAISIGAGSIDPELGTVAGAVISAPIFEEGSKGLGLVILLIFFRKYFDGILDGIVFAGVIALGFATVENVLYYGRGILQGGVPGLAILFVMRGILSPFAHVTFTAMTGIGCGIARESHNKFVRIFLPIVGYGLAVTLHAFWNGMAVLGGLGGFLLGYLILEIPFFLILVGFAFYTMFRQNKILKEMLAIDVARGLIPQEDFERATSAFKSTGWLLGSLFSGKYMARKRYLRAIGKLGLSYWHIQRATAAQGHTGSFQQNPILRGEVLKWKELI